MLLYSFRTSFATNDKLTTHINTPIPIQMSLMYASTTEYSHCATNSNVLDAIIPGI
jgi:hypothetical protein